VTRINTNIPAMTAARYLEINTNSLARSLQRLTTGYRINRGADDPSGLIVSELLRAKMGSLAQAIDNSQRAINIVATAEGALNEVSAMLASVRELVTEAASSGGLSADEIAANQLQVDSAIASVDRTSNTTTFGGLYLLNGALGFVTSSVTATQVTDLAVYQANIPVGQSTMAISVDVTQSAQVATGYYTSAGEFSDYDQTIRVTGNRGTEVLSFAAGTTMTAVASAMNTVKDNTGVSATVTATGLTFESTEYGADQFVSVEDIDNNAGVVQMTDLIANPINRDYGQNVGARINGLSAAASGRTISIAVSTLDLEVTLSVATATTVANAATGFTITGGGALFQLGADAGTAQQARLGVPRTSSSDLGSGAEGYLNQIKTGQPYDLYTNPNQALRILDQAINDVSVLRGRLGAFERNVLQTNINSLGVTLENVTAAESIIRNTDFAVETAELSRTQILVSAGTSVLATANAVPQNVLALLS